MAITVFSAPFGPMNKKTAPPPFLLNAGTYKISMQATALVPTGLEAVELQWDDSSYGTNGARGNVWSLILRLTPGSGIQSFTIPGSTNMQCRFADVHGDVLVTITS